MAKWKRKNTGDEPAMATGPGEQAPDAVSGVPETPPDGGPEGRPPSPPEPDYYDWKQRYRPWAGAEMMAPALAGAGILALLVLVLLAFVFHPIW